MNLYYIKVGDKYITKLIILIVVNLLLIIPLFSFKGFRKYYEYRFNSTIIFFTYALGYLIAIIGKIRIGKTTLMSGLSHVAQIVIQNRLNSKMEFIRNIFYFIDFQEFEQIVLYCYLEQKLNLKDITDFIIDYYKLDSNELYFNFLEFEVIKDLVFDYIDAFYKIYIRNQYVYSKTRFYSHITNKTNIQYNLNWTKIKEAFKKKEYIIEDDMVELIDEATDELGASFQYEDMKDESGAKEYRRKYGHIHRERNYMIISKQDASDEIKRYRTLTQSNIQIIEKVDVVGNFRLSNKLINLIKNFVNHFHKFKWNCIAIFKGMIYSEDRNKYIEEKFKGKYIGKSLINYLTYIEKFLFSKSYCKFKCRLYDNAQDVGKIDEKYYIEYKLVIPLQFCFGCFSTHEYSYIQNELINNSKLKFEDLEQSLMFIDPNKKYFEDDSNSFGGDVDYEY